MGEPASVLHSPTPATPVYDHIVTLAGATWADFQRMLQIRGERPLPRIAYLEGVIELMSPSRAHEVIKSMIGRLLETWCIERGVEITPYGSWTIENKDAERGIEPDECYVLGTCEDPAQPDLAIEVAWTSGGVDKLDLYRKLGVREVWIWRRSTTGPEGELSLYALRDERYQRLEASEVLPGIDLPQLLSFIDVRPMTRAVRELRAALSAG